MRTKNSYKYIELVNDLIEFAPPKGVRKSLTTLFVCYVQSKEYSGYADTNEIAADFYFLMKFLEEVE